MKSSAFKEALLDILNLRIVFYSDIYIKSILPQKKIMELRVQISSWTTRNKILV